MLITGSKTTPYYPISTQNFKLPENKNIISKKNSNSRSLSKLISFGDYKVSPNKLIKELEEIKNYLSKIYTKQVIENNKLKEDNFFKNNDFQLDKPLTKKQLEHIKAGLLCHGVKINDQNVLKI